jgi:uncharacterized membrane protein
VRDRRSGLLLAALSAAGLAIALYLTLVKVAGELPACGPLRGCEDVARSEYSELWGIPVAAFGAAFSTLVAVLGLGWWRTGDRRAAYAAYALGLVGLGIVGYLTYLEVTVIGAICVWCVGYAITVVGGWIVAGVLVRQVGREPDPGG